MAVRINLDLDTLRTFSVARELGSLGQAAEHLGRTPSAVSLQMKRLQDDLGIPLFRKQGRGLTLTEAGGVALEYARRILALHDELLDTLQGANVAGLIRIGCTQDFASILPSVLSYFSSLYPRMQVELRIEGNQALADAIEASQLDLAVILGHGSRVAAQTIGHLDIVWIASSSFVPTEGQPWPLAVLGPHCTFRRRAIEQLESNNVPYRIAATSPSLDGVWAALLGNLGITARTALNLPEGLMSSKALFNLPIPGRVAVTLHRKAQAGNIALDRMASLLCESLRLALLSQPEKQAAQARHNSIVEIASDRMRKHQ